MVKPQNMGTTVMDPAHDTAVHCDALSECAVSTDLVWENRGYL